MQDVIKTKEPEGKQGPELSIKEHLHQLNMDYPLSEHLRSLYRVGLGFEESFDDDDATDEEQAKVDSDDDGDDSEMEKATFSSINYED
ncbi:hypothetical protein HAX54_018743 [Datura stramonium]|uniref:Uncharacterized protein n=1 Tax=Datura stramonium TaxID=4076 RepID=A0ABS8UQ82_DATST|nr:hypothetical protein [Datura stramonium]